MNGRVRVFLVLFGVILMGGVIACRSQDSEPCPAETADPDGYLHTICEYIIANEIDVSPGKPDKYKILRTEVSDREDGPVVMVFLSCCYMGDRALIDQETGEVLDFWLGDQ